MSGHRPQKARFSGDGTSGDTGAETPFAKVLAMDPQAPWPGSRWRRGPTTGSYVLRIPARVATTIAGLAIVAIACTIVGVAVIDASRPGRIAGAPPNLSPGATVVLAVAMAAPVIAALVALVQIRRSSLYATRSGVWFWSGSSAVMLPWTSITSVEIRQVRRRGRTRRCTVVATQAGSSFATTATRSRWSGGGGRPNSPCQRVASALVEMVEATTGRSIGCTTPDGEPGPTVSRSEVRIRSLPEDRDRVITFEHQQIPKASAWLAATVPAVAGVAAGFLASTTLHLPGGVLVPSCIGAMIAVALWTLISALLMTTHVRHALGPDWFAWRYPVGGPWRMIAFSAVERIDAPFAPPSRWNESRKRTARNRGLVLWIRTNDGRTTTVHLAGSGEEEAGDYHARLTEVVNGSLASVSSDRIRAGLRALRPAEGDEPVGDGQSEVGHAPDSPEMGASRQAGADPHSPGVTWPPVMHSAGSSGPDRG